MGMVDTFLLSASVSLVVLAFGLCYKFIGQGYYYMFRLEGREKRE